MALQLITNSWNLNSFLLVFLFSLGVFSGESQDSTGKNSCAPVPWSDTNCFIGPVSIKTDIAPQVFSQLCPIARGRNEAPTSCDLYITCHDGSLTVNRCPTGSHYHPIDKECVDSHLFECSYPVVKDPRILFKQNKKRQVSLHWEYGNSAPFTARRRQGRDPKSDYYCQNGEEGIFPHPESCEYFIQCGSGSIFEQKCPIGTAFNPRLSVCDFKYNVDCYSRVKRRVKRAELITDPNSFYSNTKAQESHILQKRSSSSSCSKEFITPHPQFCNQFQVCSNGRFHTQTCGEGTLFDPLKKVCSSPQSVQCGARIGDFQTYACHPGLKYSTLHPEDCHKFIECENEQIHIKSCPGKTVFNPEKGFCDFSRRAVCKSLISLEHDIDINYLPQMRHRIQRDLSKYVCEFNYIAPLDGSCTNFIECENKRLFKKSCGPGTAYNPLLGQCDWPYKVSIPDPQYCQKYLQCDGRKFVPRQCPHNSFYSAEKGRCLTIDQVNCTGKVDDPKRRGEYLQSK